MNQNFELVIEKYENEYTIKNFKGCTAYCAAESVGGADQIKENTPISTANNRKSKAVEGFS